MAELASVFKNNGISSAFVPRVTQVKGRVDLSITCTIRAMGHINLAFIFI
jgi:hypothetical protein